MDIHVLDKYYLAITAIITVAYQLVFFAIAFTCKFDKLTDFAGGTNFVVLAVITLALGTHDLATPVPARQVLLTVLLVVWALRLAGFLFFRILRTGKDTRFDGKRDKFFPLLGFWVVQMVWVWAVSLPVTVLNSPGVIAHAYTNFEPLGTPRDIAGIVLFAVGFLCEAVADAQRFRFRERNKSAGLEPLAFCKTGLFAWSRHPNYFGEILVHFGIFTIASSVTHFRSGLSTLRPLSYNAVYSTITGALLLTLLLFFVSGMNLSERPAAAKRYAAGGAVWDAYRTYLHRTSILIPLPPALYAPLPVWIKRTLLLEFPLYVFDPAKHAAAVADAEGAAEADDGTPKLPKTSATLTNVAELATSALRDPAELASMPLAYPSELAANPIVPFVAELHATPAAPALPQTPVVQDPDVASPYLAHRKLPHASEARRHDSP